MLQAFTLGKYLMKYIGLIRVDNLVLVHIPTNMIVLPGLVFILFSLNLFYLDNNIVFLAFKRYFELRNPCLALVYI